MTSHDMGDDIEPRETTLEERVCNRFLLVGIGYARSTSNTETSTKDSIRWAGNALNSSLIRYTY